MDKKLIFTQSQQELDIENSKGFIVAKLESAIEEIKRGNWLDAMLLVNKCHSDFESIIKSEIEMIRGKNENIKPI